MDGVFTCQPEGFDALRAQHCVVNRLCRSLHGAFYSLFCIPNCVKRSRETYVNRTWLVILLVLPGRQDGRR